MLFSSTLAAASLLLHHAGARSFATANTPSLVTRQDHDFQVTCAPEGQYGLDVLKMQEIADRFANVDHITTYDVTSHFNFPLADHGGVKVTGVLIRDDETSGISAVENFDIAIAIDQIIFECGLRGGSAVVPPTTDFQLNVLGDWVKPKVPILWETPDEPEIPKAKRQEDTAHPDHPGLPTCNKLSLCFKDRDQVLRDCILGANGDRDAISQCWRDHSNGLAEWCRCSNADDAGSVYPVLSDANVCFITRCQSPYLECLWNGNDNCIPPSAFCMNTCLPPAELHQQLPICDNNTPCFANCDRGLQSCMLDARRDVHKVYECWNNHTTCAARDCKCDDTADQEGYPVISEAETCIKVAYYNLTICEADTCVDTYENAVKSCISEKKVARSLAPRADYKEFSFFLG